MNVITNNTYLYTNTLFDFRNVCAVLTLSFKY